MLLGGQKKKTPTALIQFLRRGSLLTQIIAVEFSMSRLASVSIHNGKSELWQFHLEDRGKRAVLEMCRINCSITQADPYNDILVSSKGMIQLFSKKHKNY
jgi:hypothetical protein